MKTAPRLILLTAFFGFLIGSTAIPAFASTPPPSGLMTLLRQGKIDEARMALEARVKASPADLGAANDLALFLATAGDLEGSRKTLESALLANPESATAFRNLRELAGQQFSESYAKAIGKVPPKKDVALDSKGLDPIALRKAMDEGRVVIAAAEAARRTELAKVERPAQGAQDVQALLEAWAKAWSKKDFNQYAGFYSTRFSVPAHKTRDAWLAFRKPRILGKKDIVVSVSNIVITPRVAGEVEVKYDQRYESGALRVRSRKTQIWVAEDDTWKIKLEQN